ncbi:MAG: hypothetical protein AAF206_00595 [Bacteroidota bacterium]
MKIIKATLAIVLCAMLLPLQAQSPFSIDLKADVIQQPAFSFPGFDLNGWDMSMQLGYHLSPQWEINAGIGYADHVFLRELYIAGISFSGTLPRTPQPLIAKRIGVYVIQYVTVPLGTRFHFLKKQGKFSLFVEGGIEFFRELQNKEVNFLREQVRPLPLWIWGPKLGWGTEIILSRRASLMASTNLMYFPEPLLPVLKIGAGLRIKL